jgi:hypothetical protein
MWIYLVGIIHRPVPSKRRRLTGVRNKDQPVVFVSPLKPYIEKAQLMEHCSWFEVILHAASSSGRMKHKHCIVWIYPI